MKGARIDFMAAQASQWWARSMASTKTPTKQVLEDGAGLAVSRRVRSIAWSVANAHLTASALAGSKSSAITFYETKVELDLSTIPPSLKSHACTCKGRCAARGFSGARACMGLL